MKLTILTLALTIFGVSMLKSNDAISYETGNLNVNFNANLSDFDKYYQSIR